MCVTAEMSETTVWRRNNPEKARAQQNKDIANKKKRDRDVGIPSSRQTKCVECGMVYDRMGAHMLGFKFLTGCRGTRCICNVCN
jgi:hypothetical protein